MGACRVLLAPVARGAAVVAGARVFSHSALDVPMPTADMPRAGNDSTKIGLAPWRHRNPSLAAELVVPVPRRAVV